MRPLTFDSNETALDRVLAKKVHFSRERAPLGMQNFKLQEGGFFGKKLSSFVLHQSHIQKYEVCEMKLMKLF